MQSIQKSSSSSHKQFYNKKSSTKLDGKAPSSGTQLFLRPNNTSELSIKKKHSCFKKENSKKENSKIEKKITIIQKPKINEVLKNEIDQDDENDEIKTFTLIDRSSSLLILSNDESEHFGLDTQTNLSPLNPLATEFIPASSILFPIKLPDSAIDSVDSVFKVNCLENEKIDDLLFCPVEAMILRMLEYCLED